MPATNARRLVSITALCLLLTVALASAAPGTKTITFADLMKFRAIGGTTISDDGKVVGYGRFTTAAPGEVLRALYKAAADFRNFLQPAMNFLRCFSIPSAFFLEMAFRKS